MTAAPSHVNPPGRLHRPERTDRDLNQDPRLLRWTRVSSGLTIRGAAQLAGCSAGHLSDLEHGNYSAGVEILQRLADVYDCKITDLMPPKPAASPRPQTAETRRVA